MERVNRVKLALPSALGVLLFLVPVRYDGNLTIPLGVLTSLTTELLRGGLREMVLAIVGVSALGSLWVSLVRPRDPASEGPLRRSLHVSTPWLLLRLVGFGLTALIVLRVGPEFVWSEATGGGILDDLAAPIVALFLFACLLLPLLTDFGLMELVGSLLRPIFRRLFRLPGRACVDAVASWMLASSVGVLITSQQYERGYYSGREAAVIATNFSIVSLPFCLLVAQSAGLGHLFLPYYATVGTVGFFTALVLPRIPPLSRLADDWRGSGPPAEEAKGQGGLLRLGAARALARAARAPGPRAYLREAATNLFDIWFGLLPSVVAAGTLGMVLVEYTPVFTWLSAPLVPVLELLQLPEAKAAAPALLVGFADMFLPAMVAQGIESELTRFVVICVSITQLIYMSEVGVLILKTRIPLGFVDLLVVFLLRTAIAVPATAAIAHAFVF